jgi:hypothetical protein
LDEVLDYYKALVEEELPHVLEDIRHQLEVEEDEPSERFADINRSINKFLVYVESTYVGKVWKNVKIRTENVFKSRNPDDDLSDHDFDDFPDVSRRHLGSAEVRPPGLVPDGGRGGGRAHDYQRLGSLPLRLPEVRGRQLVVLGRRR